MIQFDFNIFLGFVEKNRILGDKKRILRFQSSLVLQADYLYGAFSYLFFLEKKRSWKFLPLAREKNTKGDYCSNSMSIQRRKCMNI